MSSLLSSALLSVLMVMTSLMAASALRFDRDVQYYWGQEYTSVQSGKAVSLSLYSPSSGCGLQSYNYYQYGRVDVHMKHIAGNSAGTVTTFYLSSQGTNHAEIDMEFLGNTTGQPIVLHTNVFANGIGGREQQFFLWFDPTAAFHKYSIIWNAQFIIWLVDDIAIRVFNNNEAIGVAFPSEPMNVYASIWCADSWATQGGRVKTDWSYAPFTAYLRNLKAHACKVSYGYSSCHPDTQEWLAQTLTDAIKGQLDWVQKKYMKYNYCTDNARFSSTGFPSECNRPQFYQ